MTCPTCASRMVAYPNDWQVCLACAVFGRAAATPRFEPRRHADAGWCVERRAELAEVAGAWQAPGAASIS